MKVWKRESCFGCGGHGLVMALGGEAAECDVCEGSGAVYVSEGGAIAKWPGGPFVGKLTKEELANDPRR